MADPAPAASTTAVNSNLLGIRPDEYAAVGWSVLYFFCLLTAYSMLRPVRDSLAIVGGVQNIKWLFTGTFTAMLFATSAFGWLTSRYRRRQFLPWVYYFFIANMLVFYGVFTYTGETGTAYVWTARSFFCLAQRVQSVCGVRVLEFHGGHLHEQAESAAVRGHQRRRQLRRDFRAADDARACRRLLGFTNLLLLAVHAASRGNLLCVHRLRHWVRRSNKRMHKKLSPG